MTDHVSEYVRKASEKAKASREPGSNVVQLFSSATTPAVDLPSYPQDCTAQEAEVLCHSFRAIEALLDYIGGPNISNEMVARVDGLTNRARWRVECVKRMRSGE